MRTVIFVIGTLLLLTACVRDPEPIPNAPDPPAETSITIVTKQGTARIPNVYVGIANSLENRDLDVFLYAGHSDSNGEIRFENMDRATYYLSATLGDLNNSTERRMNISMDSTAHVTMHVYF